ncbi:cellulase family glycosylhydrolase [Streptomyces sp. NPDC028635]|uniref:cellulase family glycosylhydrolase n=1 Tax=Streptomyces sp. NPDC028635 TaxID=3154800 RepID=UPI0033D8FE82
MAKNHRRHRLFAAVAALVLTGTVITACTKHEPTPSPVAESKPLRIGIAYGNRLTGLSDKGLASALDVAVEVGARWVRADLSWRDVQPDGPGDYRWRQFDRIVAAAAKRHLTVLPILGYTPPWARPAGCDDEKCHPADPAAFADFAAAAAQRYAPSGIHTWEVWNEPNLPDFWKPAPDPGTYTDLLRLTSRALRHQDPSAYVIFGGLAAVHTGGTRISQSDFLAAVSARGGNRFVNAVAYHPYTFPYLPSDTTGRGTTWEAIDSAPDSLEHVLSVYGTPGLPVWITEYGAPTGGPGAATDGRPENILSTTKHVTEERQAEIAADSVRTAAGTPHVQALFWFSDHDLGTDTSSEENFFGLRRADGSAKPALGALRRAVAALRDEHVHPS